MILARRWAIPFMGALLWGGWCNLARGDAAPKPDGLHFSITHGGRPLEGEFSAAVLNLQANPQSLKPMTSNAAVVPGLEKGIPADGQSGTWTYARYVWGGKGRDGQVDFGNFNSKPDRIRLAVSLPGQSRLYLSNEAATQPLLTHYRVDLQDDGTATLTRIDTGRWLADAVVGLDEHGMLTGLGLTLLVESLVVAIAVVVLGKRALLGRMLLLCVVLNILTLPVLWVLAFIGFFVAGFWNGMIFLGCLEVAVVLFEGVFYAFLGKMRWAGLGLSLVANLASFAAGLFSGLA